MTIAIKPLLKKLTDFAKSIPADDPDGVRAKTLDDLIPVLFPGYQAVLVRNGDEMVFVGKNSTRLDPLIVDPPPSGGAVKETLDVMRSAWQHVPHGSRESVSAVMRWLKENLTRNDLED